MLNEMKKISLRSVLSIQIGALKFLYDSHGMLQKYCISRISLIDQSVNNTILTRSCFVFVFVVTFCNL